MKFDLYTIHLKLILQEELNFFQTFSLQCWQIRLMKINVGIVPSS